MSVFKTTSKVGKQDAAERIQQILGRSKSAFKPLAISKWKGIAGEQFKSVDRRHANDWRPLDALVRGQKADAKGV